MVRSWSPDTRLNGQRFDDSWLRPGDRLRVGSVEFELLSAGSLVDDPPRADEATSVPAADALPVETADEALAAAADERQFEQHLRDLLEQRHLMARHAEELELQRAEFAAERRQWSEERQQVLAELDAREACLSSLYAEIERERESLAGQHRQPVGSHSAHGRRATDAELPEPETEPEYAPEAEHARSPREMLADPPPASDAAHENRTDLDAECDTRGPVDNEPESASIPAATAESAARYVAEPHREADEFSIEDYMSQLLQRVGCGPKPTGTAAETPKPVLTPAVPERPTTPPARNVSRAAVSHAPAADGLLPRAKPLPLDLNALRDVAIQTARSAIDRHTSRIWLQAAAGKWFGVSVALIAAAGLIYWSRHYSVRSGIGIVLASLVAVFWMGQAVWLTQRAIRVRLAERSVAKGTRHPTAE